MQRRIVRRVSLGLAAGLAAAAVAFTLALPDRAPGKPATVDRSSASTLGAAVFAEHCGSCHEAREMSRGLPDAAAAAEMIAILEHHGGATLADDLLVLQWLVGPGRPESPDQLRTK
jgi:mono/diheme cytochrome c family protein